jgi:hypothetical protein
MRTDGRSYTCCLRATEEEIESDPEAFDCEACEIRQHEDALTEHDRTSMLVHRLLCGPAVQRLKLQPLVFDALGLRMTHDETLWLLQKLNVIEQDAREADGDDPPSQTSARDEESDG